jgi:uncharacterized membrane protein YkvA (DUF1232 family)
MVSGIHVVTQTRDGHAETSRRHASARRERALERQLQKLTVSRELVFDKLRDIPKRMQLLTNQVELLLDLADDYSSGRYRQVRWYTLAVAVTAALYFVSPTDVIPDWMPVIGQLDDLLVVGVALRLARKDLRAYAKHRGLDLNDYF